LALADDSPLTAEFKPDLLNGVMVVKGRGFTAIPYYAWAHRGKGQMAVWLRKRVTTNS
jgi:hypothetical protein